LRAIDIVAVVPVLLLLSFRKLVLGFDYKAESLSIGMAQLVDEYLAYVADVSSGYNIPIVAVVRVDGPITYRDFLREDLSRIPDVFSIPGGWFFKRNANSTNSWTRRFGLLRGKYMFLFHSPLNEKPIAVISLVNTVVNVPADGGKSFNAKAALANEGYEWEIQSVINENEVAHIYSLSAGERDQWVAACEERSHRMEDGKPIQVLLGHKIPTRQGSNVTISATKLEGQSPAAAVMASSQDMSYYNYSNPYYPPPPPPPAGDDDASYQDEPYYSNQGSLSGNYQSYPSNTNNSNTHDSYHPPLPESPVPMDNSELADEWDQRSKADGRLYYPDERKAVHYNEEVEYDDERGEDDVSRRSTDRAILEKGIQGVIKVQDEARKREAASREK
jgi:hypothetical protein